MDTNYKEAFSEVLEVIKNSNQNIKNKISPKFIDFLEQNKDTNYIEKINFNDANWEDSLKQESLAILALIYRDYIVSPEERKSLLIGEQEELKKLENELREKYNPDNIFKNNRQDLQTSETSNRVALTEYKESIFTKIKNWLKQIFEK